MIDWIINLPSVGLLWETMIATRVRYFLVCIPVKNGRRIGTMTKKKLAQSDFYGTCTCRNIIDLRNHQIFSFPQHRNNKLSLVINWRRISLGTNESVQKPPGYELKYSINCSTELGGKDIELILIKANRYLTIRTGFDFSFQKLSFIG